MAGAASSSKTAQTRNGRARNNSSRSNNKGRSTRGPVSQAWLNDFLSEMLAVEQGGEKLYAKALDELQHEEFRAKLEEFHEETQRHIELVREMMQAAGMDESYKSPTGQVGRTKGRRTALGRGRRPSKGPQQHRESSFGRNQGPLGLEDAEFCRKQN